MSGLDIILALDEVDDYLIEDAKRQERGIPLWLKWTSIAVCFVCVAILTLLALSRMLGGPAGTNPDRPDVLAPGMEDSGEEFGGVPDPADSPEPRETEQEALPETQPKEKTKVTLALDFDPTYTIVEAAIDGFNARSEDYYVEAVSITGQEFTGDVFADNPVDAMTERERLDLWYDYLSSENQTDIAVLGVPLKRFLLAGMRVDLNEVLDTGDILPGFWSAMETGGGNYTLPIQTRVEAFVGKTEYVGSSDLLTTEEFLALGDLGIPLFSDVTRELYVSALTYEAQHCFVDWNQGTCDFTSPDFVALLEYADRLIPAENGFPTEVEELLRHDDCLMATMAFDDFRLPYQLEYALVDAELTFLGWPNEPGGTFCPSGNIALLSGAPNAPGAIAFLQYVLSDEVQFQVAETTFPVTASGLRHQCEVLMNAQEGNMVFSETPETTIDGITYEYRPMTQAEADKYTAWLGDIQTTSYWCIEISEIMQTECRDFLDGTATARETAERIQTEVSEYLDTLNS